MNSRDYKVFRPGVCYHVYNRGNNKEPIFIDEQDYFNFLKRLKLCLFGPQAVNFSARIRLKTAPEGAFDILSYCLMPNHFHFLIHQNLDFTIDRLITSLTTSYVKYFNMKYNRVGNLFQDAFKAKVVGNDSYFSYLSAYIHKNPADPLNYDFSSFKDYLGLRQGQLCSKGLILGMFDNNVEKYKNFVLGFDSKDEITIKPYLFEEEG